MSKLFKILTGGIALVAAASTVSADFLVTDQDYTALRQFVDSKKGVDMAAKSGDLHLYGDVRVLYSRRSQKQENTNVSYNPDVTPGEQPFNEMTGFKNTANLLKNGGGGTDVLWTTQTFPLPYGSSYFQVMFNLGLKYQSDASYACGELRFKNRMGLDADEHARGNGQADQIELRRAYLGYNFLDNGMFKIAAQAGRNKLYDFYTSKIQFNSRADGASFLFNSSFENVFDLVANTGTYVINNMSNFYSYVAEIGFHDIASSGVYVGVNFVNWKQRKPTFWVNQRYGGAAVTISQDRRYAFRNVEFFAGWVVPPEMFNFPIEFYAGYLTNVAAKRHPSTNNLKQNRAYYIGAMFGKVEKANDWSLEVRFEHVEAQSIPHWDFAGITQGNLNDSDFYYQRGINTSGGGYPSLGYYAYPVIDNPLAAHGNGNYKGWAVEGMYAITDNLSLGLSFEYSNAATARIGGKNKWRNFEAEFIYAF